MMNSKLKNSQSAKLDRFEGGAAVIRFSDGQEIYWPKNDLPKSLEIGQKIVILAKLPQELVSDNQELAKNLLEQILNGKAKN